MTLRWPPAWKLWFLLSGTLFLMGFVSWFWLHQKTLSNVQEVSHERGQVAGLIADTVKMELNAGRYQSIEAYFRRWLAHDEHVIGLEVRAENGFILASSSRPGQVEHVLINNIPVEYSYHGRALVSVRTALDDIYETEAAFDLRFWVLYGIFSTLVLGLAFFAIRSKREALRAGHITRMYNALSEVNQAIVRIEQEEQLFQMVCRCAVENGGLSMAWVAMVDEKTNLFFPIAKYGASIEYIDNITVSSLASVPEGKGPTGTAYRENRPVIVNHFQENAMTRPWRSNPSRTVWKSSASFPIPRGHRPYAVLSVYHAEQNMFDKTIIELIEEMTRDIAFALDNFDRETQIHFLAYHDALTGLPNRQLARDHFDLAHSYADRAGSKMGFVFLDLDDFKTINDSLGHNAGDELLKEMADRLKACLRGTDSISRQGGDEFLILLADLPDAEGTTKVIDNVFKRLEAPFLVGGHYLTVSASIGISTYPDDGRDFDSLLKKADTAMYQAKGAGKNAYRFFTEQMNVDALEYMRIRAQLRQAVENSELVLHYQPQIDLTDGRIVGAEVLIRWQHPESGLLMPDHFIRVAEESGLIVPIGDWVLLEACGQAVKWSEAGLPPITLAVNISAMQFSHHNLEHSVMQAIVDSGIAPASLELELTESALIRDADETIVALEMMKSHGIRLSVDDFGTGYSSLSYLRRFNVDKIKIDQSFVRDMSFSENAAAIVVAIIQMAKALGLKTIAEGVEDAQTMERLRNAGCDEAQGYYFSKPLPNDAFEKFVSTHSAAHVVSG